MQQVILKLSYAPTKLHGLTFQKTVVVDTRILILITLNIFLFNDAVIYGGFMDLSLGSRI